MWHGCLRARILRSQASAATSRQQSSALNRSRRPSDRVIFGLVNMRRMLGKDAHEARFGAIKPGDVVLLDTYQVLHGRDVFEGEREHGVLWLK